jgi:hypothetical protein
MTDQEEVEVTLDNLSNILSGDISVKVAGVDIDGVLRGKLMAKKKFLSIAEEGFGFCSVIFGWDMHDKTYFRELKVSNKENGYRDLIAVPDFKSFRRIPWENNVPFFLVKFLDPDTHQTLSACPRSLLGRVVEKLHSNGYKAMAGGKLILVDKYIILLEALHFHCYQLIPVSIGILKPKLTLFSLAEIYGFISRSRYDANCLQPSTSFFNFGHLRAMDLSAIPLELRLFLEIILSTLSHH